MNKTVLVSSREALLVSPVARFLQVEPTDRENVFRLRFAEQHIGNPFVRTLHGGVVAALMEFSAEMELLRQEPLRRAEIVSSAIDYLRVTRDADVQARVDIVRIARRLAFVDVWCWQEREDAPVARGSCMLRLLADKT